MDENKALTAQLRRLAVEQRPTACLGCGFEHRCSLYGCQVMKKAAAILDTKTTPDDAAVDAFLRGDTL